jgi:hypothetical protein
MMQVRSRRTLGNSEESADFRVLISLDVVQHDDRALPFAQCAQRAGQPRA